MAVDPKITVNQPAVPQEDSGPAIPESAKLPSSKKQPQEKQKLAPGLDKLKRPYINTDEVLRIGSVLERKMKLTEVHRQSFDWLAYTRTQDMQRMPEFFGHLQRSIGGVLMTPRLAVESIHYLFGRNLLTPTERDTIIEKMKGIPLANVTLYAIGELLRNEAEAFRGAVNFD